MSFQTGHLNTVIIWLPVVKPKSNSVFLMEYSSSHAKRQNAEWITQKVMCAPSQLPIWVQSFDFEGSKEKVISD